MSFFSMRDRLRDGGNETIVGRQSIVTIKLLPIVRWLLLRVGVGMVKEKKKKKREEKEKKKRNREKWEEGASGYG